MHRRTTPNPPPSTPLPYLPRLDRRGPARLDEPRLEAGEEVKLSSFGTFSVQSKRQRVGRNPKTGVEALITPRRVLSFRPSHILKDRVDNS